MDLDLSEYTDARTVSHKHAAISFNRAKQIFEVRPRFIASHSSQLVNWGRNGTRINGLLFGKSDALAHPLTHGTIIKIGKISLVFELVGAENSPYAYKS